MTKIYLVKISYMLKEGNKWYDTIGQVFTNKRKAIAYKRYKDAKARNEKKTENCWFEEYESMIDEVTIENYDYTEWAIKEETKELPY